MYERAWPRWLWSYVVGPQTYILTTPGVRGENGSFLRERVLYNRRTMVAAVASTGPALSGPLRAGSNETRAAFCAEGVFRVDRSVARRAAVFDRRAAPTAEPVRRTQRRATSRACALGRIRRGLPGAVRAQDDVAAMTSERLPPRRPGAAVRASPLARGARLHDHHIGSVGWRDRRWRRGSLFFRGYGHGLRHRRSAVKNLSYWVSFEITTLFTRGAVSGASCSRYVR